MSCHKEHSSSSSSFSYLAVIGFFVVWFTIIRLLIWLLMPFYRRYIRRKSVDKIWQPSPTNWAVVTGGTDGIGLAYCKQLATLGYPLLIISRSEDKLKNVKKEIECTIPQCPEVRILSFDFGLNSHDHYNIVEQEIRSLSPGMVDVLVNNVGISFVAADYFTVIARRNPEILSQMIHVNVVSMLKMTQLVWKPMLDRNRGIILNVG